jgi:hypothetical protein
MNAIVFVVAGLLAVGFQAQKTPDRVGRIIIEGNTDTPDRFILRFIDARPGQILNYPQLAEAQRKLVALRHFDRTDPPTVEVFANDFGSAYKDVIVRVKERPGNWVPFLALDVAVGVAQRDPRMVLGAVATVLQRVRNW